MITKNMNISNFYFTSYTKNVFKLHDEVSCRARNMPKRVLIKPYKRNGFLIKLFWFEYFLRNLTAKQRFDYVQIVDLEKYHDQ